MIDLHNKLFLRQGIYIIILLSLCIFLYQLGAKPWILVFCYWPTLIAVMTVASAGIVVQAASYRISYPKGSVPLSIGETSRIWAASAIVSIVAPIFAGLATRTTMLLNAGTPLSICVLASIRQIWMGLEYAALIGGVTIIFIDLEYTEFVSIILFLMWMLMLIVRFYTVSVKNKYLIVNTNFISALSSSYPRSAHGWFLLQLVLMSSIYYLAFQGVGADLNWVEAFALSAITVFVSLIAFVPNGYGITDAVWVFVAVKTGLSLEASVALAILLRIGHLLSAVCLYLTLQFIYNRQFKPAE